MSDNGDLQRSLNLFASYAFEPSFWRLGPQERGELLRSWWEGLDSVAHATHYYQLFPSAAGADLLIWSTIPLEGHQDTADLFERYSQATTPHRSQVRPVQALWGYTGKSDYSKARSSQEIDPFGGRRDTYLIVYPFVKTKEWYLMRRDARQGMMNEHIRLGKQYTAIKQLLLYSFGLQDQEFVVVYETDDLPLFSELVYDLRSTEARRFTERDAPLQTAVYSRPEKLLENWAAV